jgi:hypothetical protein
VYAAIRLVASLGALVVVWATVVIALMAVYWFGWSYLTNIEMLAAAIPRPPALIFSRANGRTNRSVTT